MTIGAFRRMCLALPFAEEHAHMNHPDFRIRNRIFASLPSGDGSLGMVMLTPAQQKQFVKQAPDIFTPVPGGWGKRGATYVQLSAAPPTPVRRALRLAWENVAPRSLASELAEPPARTPRTRSAARRSRR